MTRTDPCRRITLHFSHIFLTEGRTFISVGSLSLQLEACGEQPPLRSCPTYCLLLVAVRDATAREVVRRELDLDAVTRSDADVVHAHLPGNVGEDLVPVLEFDTEHGIGERFDDRSFDQDRVVLGFGQRGSPPRELGQCSPRESASNGQRADRKDYWRPVKNPNRGHALGRARSAPPAPPFGTLAAPAAALTRLRLRRAALGRRSRLSLKGA
jgi:hypothetical protein